jgi:hypothetical protein
VLITGKNMISKGLHGPELSMSRFGTTPQLLSIEHSSHFALATTWVPKLLAVTDALDAGARQRKAAVDALAHHQTSINLFIDDSNLDIDGARRLSRGALPR